MPSPRSFAADLLNAARGLLMGSADIIPGVSGGTVALLLGIYPRLLGALSSVDAELGRLVLGGQWRKAAEHLDLRFLLALAAGILTGIVTLAGVLHWLLEEYRRETLAAFFGLILASSILVIRMVQPRAEQQVRCWLLGLAATGFAAWLVLGGHLKTPDSLPALFLSGAIAICAMILPGISGAYILVLLGKYEYVTGILHHLKAGEVSAGELGALAVFAAGCLVGLLSFSKVLKLLLARYYSPTMAVLGGFMIGSLAKVWPYQSVVEVVDEKEITRPTWPEAMDGQVAMCLAIAVGAFVAVIVADAIARRQTGVDDGAQVDA